MTEAHIAIESFFRVYLQDGRLELPVVSIHAGLLAHMLTCVFCIGAIMLGRHSFVAPALVERWPNAMPRSPGWLVVHEVTHV